MYTNKTLISCTFQQLADARIFQIENSIFVFSKFMSCSENLLYNIICQLICLLERIIIRLNINGVFESAKVTVSRKFKLISHQSSLRTFAFELFKTVKGLH